MCGICGYVHLDKTKRPSGSILKNMMDALSLRGPDDEGVYLKDNVALGHRRLSIIDLQTGHQPIFNEDSSIAIVYNGEIYNFRELRENLQKNHRFKTHSDTEVIVHAYEEYGEDCVKHFNGMFAFAIWDSKKDCLFLARDRFGKKPLYYGTFDNQFIFGSELKAILKHPSVRKDINFDALAKYLAYEYVPSPDSIFKNIYKLQAGSRLTIKGTDRRMGRYWNADLSGKGGMDIKDAEERLKQLLERSVKKRLVSDVPLGVFLSGGIDSSAVVSMMAESMHPKDIKTFSIGFEEASFDESRDARFVADYFGTDHHEEILSPTAMLDALPDIFGLLDEPFADSSIIPTYLVSRFTRKYVKVALGGDGGDELFLGYPSFLAHKLNRILNRAPSLVKEMTRKLGGVLAPSNDHLNRFLRGLGFPEEVRQQVWIGSFTPDKIAKVLLHCKGPSCEEPAIYDLTYKLFQETKDIDFLDRAMYIYMKTYMSDDILTKVDRASMANSLEVRAPFLDIELAEFAMKIPSSLKLRGFKSKWILKDSLKDKLPSRILNKPKHGFAVPVSKWLREDLKGLLDSAFDRKKIERQGIFDHSYIQGMLDHFIRNGEMKREIWALFMFEMWYDKWM